MRRATNLRFLPSVTSSSNRYYSVSKPFGSGLTGSDLTPIVSQAAERNQRYDSSMDIMEALHSREGVPLLKPPMTMAPMYRVDDFPYQKVSQNAFKTPKSHVGSGGELVPVHTGSGGASVEEHVEGKPENKARSPFTSVTQSADLSAAMMSELKGWGAKTLVIDPKRVNDALSPMEAQSDMRRNATAKSYETAKTRGGEDWHPMADKMFETPERQEAMRQRIANIGIDMDRPGPFTNLERAQIFNEALGEHLIKGTTAFGAVTKIVPTSEAMESMRQEQAESSNRSPDDMSDSRWVMNQINEALNRRG